MTCPWKELTIKDFISDLQTLPQDDVIEASFHRDYPRIDDTERIGYIKNIPDNFSIITLRIKHK